MGIGGIDRLAQAAVGFVAEPSSLSSVVLTA